MAMTHIARSFVLLAAVAACGDDGGATKVDASVADMTIPPDGLPAGCDYAEQRDTTNDDVNDPPGTPEATGLTFRDETVICGTLDASHFDGDITVDVDGYTLTVANETDALLRMRATGADTIELVGIDVYTGPNLDQRIGEVTFYGSHGVSSIHLAAGTYELVAFALHGEAITAPIAYELELVIDTPALRCPELATGGFAEARDTAGNLHAGNDMYAVASVVSPTLSASGTDMPEMTNFTLSPSADQRISGSTANTAASDMYEDKDTFAFSTGSQANELTVRLGWLGTNANLDFILFEANSAAPVSRSLATATTGPAAKSFAVSPRTAYWLMIGAKAGITAAKPYSATLCTANFAL